MPLRDSDTDTPSGFQFQGGQVVISRILPTSNEQNRRAFHNNHFPVHSIRFSITENNSFVNMVRLSIMSAHIFRLSLLLIFKSVLYT